MALDVSVASASEYSSALSQSKPRHSPRNRYVAEVLQRAGELLRERGVEGADGPDPGLPLHQRRPGAGEVKPQRGHGPHAGDDDPLVLCRLVSLLHHRLQGALRL